MYNIFIHHSLYKSLQEAFQKTMWHQMGRSPHLLSDQWMGFAAVPPFASHHYRNLTSRRIMRSRVVAGSSTLVTCYVGVLLTVTEGSVASTVSVTIAGRIKASFNLSIGIGIWVFGTPMGRISINWNCYFPVISLYLKNILVVFQEQGIGCRMKAVEEDELRQLLRRCGCKCNPKERKVSVSFVTRQKWV